MSEIPKKLQQHFEDIKKYLGVGDEEAVQELLKNRDPYAIRDMLGTAMGQHVNQNYDNPANAFENLKNPKIDYGALPNDVAGKYNMSTGGILMPPKNPDLASAQTGDLMHELGHKNDIENKNWIYDLAKDKSSQPGSIKNITGLPAAAEEFAGHHEGGFFEKNALEKLLQNKKLGMILPALGAAGIGASALGIGNKAMAGDTGGAGMDAADLGTDLVPGLGEAKMAIRPTELGAEPTDPASLKGSVFENDQQNNFKRLQQLLGNK